jgi:hypothetical protein
MKRNIYSSIKSLGPDEVSMADNPLSYCLNNTIDQRFLHGGNSDIYGQHSKPCQAYLSDYCAEGWDDFCETASQNKNYSYPNNIDPCSNDKGLNSGEILIRNTASKKYLIAMGNCVQKFEPFDPTVASSPMISYWIPGYCGNNSTSGCQPVYAVNPKNIDNDVVMNKLLSKPVIALDILINIFHTMTKDGSIKQLKGTKLGQFFNENANTFRNM